jgi:hypothetical protein
VIQSAAITRPVTVGSATATLTARLAALPATSSAQGRKPPRLPDRESASGVARRPRSSRPPKRESAPPPTPVDHMTPPACAYAGRRPSPRSAPATSHTSRRTPDPPVRLAGHHFACQSRYRCDQFGYLLLAQASAAGGRADTGLGGGALRLGLGHPAGDDDGVSASFQDRPVLAELGVTASDDPPRLLSGIVGRPRVCASWSSRTVRVSVSGRKVVASRSSRPGRIRSSRR